MSKFVLMKMTDNVTFAIEIDPDDLEDSGEVTAAFLLELSEGIQRATVIITDADGRVTHGKATLGIVDALPEESMAVNA